MLINVHGRNYLDTTDTNYYDLQNAIFTAIDSFYRYTAIHIKNTKVITNPESGEVYDKRISPLPMSSIESFRENGMIAFPDYFINRINKIELRWGNLNILDIPSEWIVSQSNKRGNISLVPISGSAVMNSIGWTILASTYGVNDYGFWHLDYECGWDETVQGVYPFDLLRILALCSIIELKHWNLDGGSLSMDGVSESLPSARQALNDELKNRLNRFRIFYIGTQMGIV